ncbi:MAG: hypothetical protein ACRDF0_05655 [Candidatus Limnocylindria bacterium]
MMPRTRADPGLARGARPTAPGGCPLFSSNDPERQANIAFALIFLGIVAVGGLTIWLFYGGVLQ